MKKLLVLLSTLLLSVGILAFAGCSESPEKQFEGKFYLTQLTAFETRIIQVSKNDEYAYRYFDQYVDFSELYIECKDGKMTVHGTLSYLVADKTYIPEDGVASDIYFDIDPVVKEYSYELKVSERNKNYYDVYLDGELSHFSFLPKSDGKPASIIYQSGEMSKAGYQIYVYEKEN